MTTTHGLPDTLQEFAFAGKRGKLHSLPRLGNLGPVARLPRSLRVVLESLVRNVDGKRITADDVRALIGWQAKAARTREIPFVVARIVLQDFTGVPLLVDLAAMRSAAARMGRDPALIEPLVPVDLVIDHSVQVDFAEVPDALQRNMEIEFRRNHERYEFLKWGTQAFAGFNVVPPGIGIVHQVNLELLAKGVIERDGVYFPDSLVGTDSHTTMIGGLGILGWGVGGIEAEAGMLGQPVYFLTPDVVGVHLTGALQPGVTATDLVLTLTELLRKHKVVGKFVEFFGEGAASLAVPDRATISNMAPEYGATIGYFPVDERTCEYLAQTGREPAHVDAFRQYYTAQQMFGMPDRGELDFSEELSFDLATVVPSVAGPRRPQDRIALPDLKTTFEQLLQTMYAKPVGETRRLVVLGGNSGPVTGGGEQAPETAPEPNMRYRETTRENTSTLTEIEMMQNRPTPNVLHDMPSGEFPTARVRLRHGDVVIAAITSCTNTSNPRVMLRAGLLAQKAVMLGLAVGPAVKTSLAPGSRVVTEYLTATGLQKYLDALGFQTVGYGCTTCIGNSGPLDPHLDAAIVEHDLVVTSVLSGNRNFEARIHQNVRANFLMSPPLVVAFALAGRIDIDLTQEPIGTAADGKQVFLRDVWPSDEEVEAVLDRARDPAVYRALYSDILGLSPMWAEIPAGEGKAYAWDEGSTYIQEPPYFERFALAAEPTRPIVGARALAIFGDSVTTDHISPAGSIQPRSPAGVHLQEHGVTAEDFNSYGSRRGNDRVMVRGTFANVRIRNLMIPGVEGGVTTHQPTGERMGIYDAAERYQADGIPLVVFAGQEYGTGSSRDWAAKGTRLLGVRAVIAESFERIHRSNLVGMGVLPCQFATGTNAQTLGLNGREYFDIRLDTPLRPQQAATLVIHRDDDDPVEIPITVHLDTPIEVDYYNHGGILPYVLRQLLGASGTREQVQAG